MMDHQAPLFSRYDMSVVFERQIKGMEGVVEREWSVYSTLSHQEIFNSLCFEILPIELMTAKAALCQQQVPSREAFSLTIPYYGDEELWHLYPLSAQHGIIGELFRGNLVLTSREKKEKKAKIELEHRLSEIVAVLGHQQQRLLQFEDLAFNFIKKEARKAKAKAAAKFIDLDLRHSRSTMN